MARISKKLYKFQSGDKVKCKLFGKGIVEGIDMDKTHFPLKVNFEDGSTDYFSLEGFYELFNDKPDLELIKK